MLSVRAFIGLVLLVGSVSCSSSELVGSRRDGGGQGHDDGGNTLLDAALGDSPNAGDSSALPDTDAFPSSDGSANPDSAPTLEISFDTEAYVDNRLSAACSGRYDPASRQCNGADDKTAYPSLQAATSHASPGVLFLIRGGTYSETLHMSVSGTDSAYIGYSGYLDEKVVISGADSIDQGESYGPVWFDKVSYNLVEKIQVTGSVGFARAVGANHNIVRNSLFDTSTLFDGASKRGGLYFAWSDYNRIINNRIIKGTDSLTLVASNYNVVEGNQIDLAGHDIFSLKCANHNVIRGNVLTNAGQQKLGSVFDCESATASWHGNGSFAQNSAILNATQHNLIEKNLFHDTVYYYSTSGGNGIQYAGQRGILRNNVFYRANVGLGMAHYSSEAKYNYQNRVYNNVFHQNQCGGVSLSGGSNSSEVYENIFKNNIFYDNKGWSEDCFGDSAGQLLYRGTIAGYHFINNNLFSPLGNLIFQQEFNQANRLGDTFPGSDNIVDSLQVNPGFVDAPSRDYRLRTDSPMIDVGVPLTQVSSSTGSGATLQVEDARYFYDGFGIPGERGDWVRLAGHSTPAQIIAVDYDTNKLTVDRVINWESGQGISLDFGGLAPDLGAREHVPGDAP